MEVLVAVAVIVCPAPPRSPGEGEGGVARGVGGDDLLAEELLALVAGGVGVELDEEGPAWGAVERAQIVVLPETVLAEERTGLFCRLFGPTSASPVSLGVAP